MDKKSRCPTFWPWQIIQIYGEASPILPSSPVLRWPGPRSRKLHWSVFWNQKNIKIYKSYWYLNIKQIHNMYNIYIYNIIYISVRISTIFVCKSFVCKSYIRISTQSQTNTNKYETYISLIDLWILCQWCVPQSKQPTPPFFGWLNPIISAMFPIFHWYFADGSMAQSPMFINFRHMFHIFVGQNPSIFPMFHLFVG